MLACWTMGANFAAASCAGIIKCALKAGPVFGARRFLGGALAFETRPRKRLPAAVKWLAVAAWMAIILFLSTERVEADYGALMPNAVHFIEYAVLALLVRFALLSGASIGTLLADGAAFLWATSYGVLMEIVQLYVPTRSADIKDAVVNSLGALAVLSAARMLSAVKGKPD